jgi:hypothetical protein
MAMFPEMFLKTSEISKKWGHKNGLDAAVKRRKDG